MKFEELSILKYGTLVDFKPISFEPNINVLLGDNGSGKSSIVKSLYHLLFGMPAKQDQHFYYDYDCEYHCYVDCYDDYYCWEI